ncbi:MAG: acyltransferase family protein, partial [Bryobacteraceae bacterium]
MLDGIRAVAALTVVGYHYSPSCCPWIPGRMAVLAFYVLSGFLITHLLLEESESTGAVSLSRFYWRRSLRIFPAFYVYWVVGLAVTALLLRRVVWGDAASALFYVSNYYLARDGPHEPFVGHTWSLALEEQFYLLWPVVFVKLRGDLRRMARVLAGVVVATWIYRSLLALWGVKSMYLISAFETRMDHLAVGCLLAVAMRLGWVKGRVTGRRRPDWAPAVTAALLAATAGAEHALPDVYTYT